MKNTETKRRDRAERRAAYKARARRYELEEREKMAEACLDALISLTTNNRRNSR